MFVCVCAILIGPTFYIDRSNRELIWERCRAARAKKKVSSRTKKQKQNKFADWEMGKKRTKKNNTILSNYDENVNVYGLKERERCRNL